MHFDILFLASSTGFIFHFLTQLLSKREGGNPLIFPCGAGTTQNEHLGIHKTAIYDN